MMTTHFCDDKICGVIFPVTQLKQSGVRSREAE